MLTEVVLLVYLLQCFVVSALNFGQLSIGLGIGYSAILIPQLERGPDVDTEVRIEVGLTETSWIVSLVSVGQVGGAVLGALLASAIGRKGGSEYWAVKAISNTALAVVCRRGAAVYSAEHHGLDRGGHQPGRGHAVRGPRALRARHGGGGHRAPRLRVRALLLRLPRPPGGQRRHRHHGRRAPLLRPRHLHLLETLRLGLPRCPRKH